MKTTDFTSVAKLTKIYRDALAIEIKLDMQEEGLIHILIQNLFQSKRFPIKRPPGSPCISSWMELTPRGAQTNKLR